MDNAQQDQTFRTCRTCGRSTGDERPERSLTFTDFHGIHRSACDECIKWAAASCLSAEPHDDNIKEYLYHYLGCIELCERRDFFKPSNKLWAMEIEHLVKQGKPRQVAEVEVEKKRFHWEKDCLNELKRIGFLRRTLELDASDKHLTQRVDESREKWRRSTEYQNNHELVKTWRRDILKKPVLDKDESTVAVSIRHSNYDPEKDINVPVIQFEARDNAFRSAEEEDPRVWGSFPDQKTTVDYLLELGQIKRMGHSQGLDHEQGRKQKLLYKGRNADRIRYFHFPSNNMAWVEEAIAQYFGQQRPDFEAMQRDFRNMQRNEAYQILRPAYWRGQFHGGPHAPAHSRYMRPLCEVVSSNPRDIESNPQNMVLFMPYLHWDTSRQRERFANESSSVTAKWEEKKRDDEFEFRQIRKERWEWLRQRQAPVNKASSTVNSGSSWFPFSKAFNRIFNNSNEETDTTTEITHRDTSSVRSHQRRRRFTQTKIHSWGPLVWLARKQAGKKPKTWDKMDRDSKGRLVVRHELGQYLLDAARLYEGVSNYRDKKLIQTYLAAEPVCMHPRRTLDQAYYWTLNDTHGRDKDQVVYRSTTAAPGSFHEFSAESCKWPKHEEYHIHGTCLECKANIRKVSRVIMVDQLWMWILDAKTIITCFPKRYGVNKHDPSGVHKAIRTRIRMGHYQIRSVFDLALIILDESTNIFFDRTKTGERQPQVIDAFATAIGNVMHNQTRAFEKLWHWTQRAGNVYRSGEEGDEIHKALLDIYQEGQLEREIKDIIEEIGIMIHITRTHRDILKSFIKNAKRMLWPGHERWMHEVKIPGHESKYHELSKEQKDNYDWFTLNADELAAKVEDRIEQLGELERSAKTTADGVKDLLDLKQQQASVAQAWQSARQSEEGINQSRSLMVLTVVTIVFLPLSFMSSVFGMNASEFSSGNNLSLGQQFELMFPISAIIIIFTFCFAFGTWIRAAFWWLYKTASTRIIVHSGAYNLWLAFNTPSSRLYKSATEETNRLKKRVKERRMERAEKKLSEEEVRSERNAATATAAGATDVTRNRNDVRHWVRSTNTKADDYPEGYLV